MGQAELAGQRDNEWGNYYAMPVVREFEIVGMPAADEPPQIEGEEAVRLDGQPSLFDGASAGGQLALVAFNQTLDNRPADQTLRQLS